MFRILISTLVGLLVVGSLSANASGLVTQKDVLDYSNNVVMHLSRVQLDDAWRKMKTNANIPPAQIDMFARQYKAHYEHTIQHYGPAVGVEHVSTEMSGQSFIRTTHLIKYEVKAVAWFMIFYKVRDSWVLNEFNYDINTNTIFNVASQANTNSSEQALARAWQSEIEARLASIEANKPALVGGPTPVVANATMDAQDVAILRETQQRLASLEEKYSQLAQHEPVATSLDNISPDTTNAEMASLQMAALGETEQRLASLEARMATLAQQSGNQSGSADGQDLESIKATIEILKKQHPFAKFPLLD